MRHAGTQTIETERLLLRPLTPEDAPMMYANWANDPDVTRWLRWEPHKNVDETRELLAAWALLYPNGDYYEWGIVEKATGQLFGTIGVFTSSSAEPERDPLARLRPHERRVGSGLLHRQGLVEPRLYHRSAKSSCRILVQKYR